MAGGEPKFVPIMLASIGINFLPALWILIPLLSEHFAPIVYVTGSRFDKLLIARERSQVVIQEFVERVPMCLDLRTC